MLKISQIGTKSHGLALKLEGRVVGPWVGELQRTCEPLLSEQPMLDLDLAEVSFVDEEGLVALNRLKSRGAQLTNCSPFVLQQLSGR